MISQSMMKYLGLARLAELSELSILNFLTKTPTSGSNFLCRYHNGEELENSHDLTLTVEATRDSAGEYACTLANTVGQGASQPVHIDVLCEF
jgi:hypothetical protein